MTNDLKEKKFGIIIVRVVGLFFSYDNDLKENKGWNNIFRVVAFLGIDQASLAMTTTLREKKLE